MKGAPAKKLKGANSAIKSTDDRLLETTPSALTYPRCPDVTLNFYVGQKQGTCKYPRDHKMQKRIQNL